MPKIKINKERFKEPSTYAAFGVIAAIFGVPAMPEGWEQDIAKGVAALLAGFGIVLGERSNG